ncbi:replication initiation factor domain-containing protein [Pseudomonadota bacterium]
MKTPSHKQASNTTSGSGHRGASRLMASTGDGCSPRTVIRGESFIPPSQPNTDDLRPLDGVIPYAAHTDWLNCTFQVTDEPEFLSHFIHQFFSIVGTKFAPMEERGKGLHGWQRSFKLSNTGAMLGIGGQNNTAFLSLTGDACTLIPLDAWPTLATLLYGHYQAQITRWDGAVDDYEGNHSVDWAVSQYKANNFNAGGNRPKCNQHGNWIDPDGSGRTFEVGKRKNGKLIRIYEKGRQLGDPNSGWVRWELELHNKSREIPWDVLINPGAYVAGAYPCTQWVSKEMNRIKTLQKEAKISYDSLTHYARLAYGSLINVMMEKEGSPEKVIETLIRDGKPARLQLPVPPEHTGPILPWEDQ